MFYIVQPITRSLVTAIISPMLPTKILNQTMNKTLLAGLCMALLCLGVTRAQAANLDDIQALMFKNDLGGALTQLDQHLTENPKDRDGRFLKGILLTEMRRLPEAIEVFTALTRDEPKLPEPYNNLAVIYAAQGRFDKAREALELAIKTHPSYSVAHENLGDLYAKLASIAYDKALELDRANTTTQTKLALIRDLFAPPFRATAESTPAPANPIASTTVEPARTPAKTARIAPTATTKAPATTPTPTTGVESTVHAWAAAWGRQDVAAYLAHYSDNFKPASAAPLEQWKADRDTRIKAPKSILIELMKLEIKVDGDSATATFKQHYKSDRLNEWTRKTLQLRRETDAWRIVDER